MQNFTIHGARGTMPVAGRAFARYGTQTTCFSLRTDQGLLIIDAGTGLIALSERLARARHLPPITFVFTHFHLDHVMALPLFKPLYNLRARITFMADPRRPEHWPTTLKTLVGRPFWPVNLTACQAQIRFHDLPVARGFLDLYGIRLFWCPVRHPQQCLAYRLETPNGSVVVATDHEHGNRRREDALLKFCARADNLIYDAQYTPTEYPAHRGWGHSTWRTGARIARAAGVRRLFLTHHDRYRTDDEVADMVRQARRIFRHTAGARDGRRVPFRSA